MGHIHHSQIYNPALRKYLAYHSIHLWSMDSFWQIRHNNNICYFWVYLYNHLGPVQTGIQFNSKPFPDSTQKIYAPPPAPPFLTPVGLFPHPFHCLPLASWAKSTVSAPVETQQGRVWLLTLNPLWSDRLLSRNRWHLGNLKTHTGERYTLPDTYSYRKIISRGGRIKVYWPFYQKSTSLWFTLLYHSIREYLNYPNL